MARRSSFSRYQKTPTRREQVRRSGLREVLTCPGAYDPDPVQLHLVHQGDRLDLLAYRYYGDPTKWWVVADANRDLLPVEQLPFALLEGDMVGAYLKIPREPVRSAT